MTRPVFLELLPGPGLALPANPRLVLSERPLRLGRSPDNDLVLADETVSGHHAAVACERGVVLVRDLASTNGTFVDDARVDAEARMRHGQVLRLGISAALRLVAPDAASSPVALWRLEVVETGASVGVPEGGLCVGLGPGVDLSLALEGRGSFTVRPNPQGGEILGEGLGWTVPAGVAFALGGLHFRILPGAGHAAPTVGARVATDSYRLRVTLNGPVGPEATLFDPDTQRTCCVRAENRAVLLYVLGSRMLQDCAARVPAENQGWCSDDEVAAGIWGRDAGRIQANNLNVLVFRLRREIEQAGFDTSFIEKRHRALRARLVHIAVS